jgi:hypothetical protein
MFPQVSGFARLMFFALFRGRIHFASAEVGGPWRAGAETLVVPPGVTPAGQTEADRGSYGVGSRNGVGSPFAAPFVAFAQATDDDVGARCRFGGGFLSKPRRPARGLGFGLRDGTRIKSRDELRAKHRFSLRLRGFGLFAGPTSSHEHPSRNCCDHQASDRVRLGNLHSRARYATGRSEAVRGGRSLHD